MNKTKLIATSGLCAAVATLALLVCGVPSAKYFVVIFGVIAAIAVCIPLLIDGCNLVYSVLAWFASSLIGFFAGTANILYVAPVVLFFVPFAVIKAYGESVKVTAQINTERTLEDPFGEKDKQFVALEVKGKKRLPAFVKWILYYVVLEAGIGVTVLLTKVFTPYVFEQMVSNDLFWWLVAAMQLVTFPYDLLLKGCFVSAKKLIRKTLNK